MSRDKKIELKMSRECLVYRVRILNRVITGLYEKALRPYQLHVGQMNLLVAISLRGPILAAEISRLFRLDKSTLSRDLERLLANDWVRTKSGSGRAQPLEITESGYAVIQAVAPAWEEAQTQARKLLGDSLTKELYQAVDQRELARADEE